MLCNTTKWLQPQIVHRVRAESRSSASLLNFASTASICSPVVRVNMATWFAFPLAFGQTRLLVNHPDLIEQVLVVQQHKFHKSALSKVATGRLLGNGLLNSEGDFWRRQRRLAQPAFQKTRVNEYAATMVEHALAYTAQWRDGEVRDMAHEMSRLTCGIAVKDSFWH